MGKKQKRVTKKNTTAAKESVLTINNVPQEIYESTDEHKVHLHTSSQTLEMLKLPSYLL